MKNIDDFLEQTFDSHIQKKTKSKLKKRPSSSLPPSKIEDMQFKEKPKFSSVSAKNIYEPLSFTKDPGATKKKVQQQLASLSQNPTNLQETLKVKGFQLDKYHKDKKYSKRERLLQKLSHKELKAKGIFHLPKNTKLNYKDYQAMTSLWNQYILSLLGPKVDPMQACQKMVKADYHGAAIQGKNYAISVYNCKNPTCIGIKGIVLQETLRLFILVTKENQVKKILKSNTVFVIKLPESIRSFEDAESPLYLKIFGDHLLYRATDRTKVKFKEKHIMALI